ncbi:MAG: aspartate--ammonia ligase [Peptoniphilaceae bacterium]|nr:aspartate--ammonia ligase [Peptoniphilaceae bacterium]MDY6019770.1 aspartate--ammonia ligase [Anaerococcus sp.]
MTEIYAPKDYKSDENLYRTQMLIKEIKDFFQINLSNNLNLKRVSAPLFVDTKTGLNDNLSGVEEPVTFSLPEADNQKMEIVHSLAKWKRFALKKYNFKMHEGLYTDMNAIRRCEIPDNTHSFYVDQWDWELIIDQKDRNVEYLEATVQVIFNTLRALDEYICNLMPTRVKLLPQNIHFMTTQELLDLYPDLSPSQREREAVKKYKAVFLMQIGKELSNGKVHDMRAPDYDDWDLNGDILVYNPVLDDVLELSSMGIRVDSKSLIDQLEKSGKTERLQYDYHKLLANNKLPLTIGGGIGQSRLCMYFLQKAHIGEVQVSYWPKDMRESLKEKGINLL